MKLLNVIFNGWGERWQLGTLADNGKDILFEYSPEALRRDIELALSSAATCRSIQRFPAASTSSAGPTGRLAS
jgi:hypothetical protein